MNLVPAWPHPATRTIFSSHLNRLKNRDVPCLSTAAPSAGNTLPPCSCQFSSLGSMCAAVSRKPCPHPPQALDSMASQLAPFYLWCLRGWGAPWDRHEMAVQGTANICMCLWRPGWLSEKHHSAQAWHWPWPAQTSITQHSWGTYCLCRRQMDSLHSQGYLLARQMDHNTSQMLARDMENCQTGRGGKKKGRV